jgi:Mg2+ and Co2+ transporter CorA
MAEKPARRSTLPTLAEASPALEEPPSTATPNAETRSAEEPAAPTLGLSVNTNVQPRAQSEADIYGPGRQGGGGETSNFSPILRRRSVRAATFKNVEDYEDFDHTYSARPGWEPGAEPGYDPLLPNGGHAAKPTLNADCEITVVDFNANRMVKRHFDNENFIEFLERHAPKDDWAKCRWINVNGLSWDVISAIGEKKGLHKLAIEDIMNIRNRTKTDW